MVLTLLLVPLLTGLIIVNATLGQEDNDYACDFTGFHPQKSGNAAEKG